MGDDQAMPLHVGVIANGHGLVLEHDVFYNVRNAVVFWNAEGGTSHRNAMRNCLVYGASVSAFGPYKLMAMILIFATTSLRTVESPGFVSKEECAVIKQLLPFSQTIRIWLLME